MNYNNHEFYAGDVFDRYSASANCYATAVDSLTSAIGKVDTAIDNEIDVLKEAFEKLKLKVDNHILKETKEKLILKSGIGRLQRNNLNFHF